MARELVWTHGMDHRIVDDWNEALINRLTVDEERKYCDL